ncbi:glycosyltransferase family 2 protein [Pedobacter nanyangensis]|uniref:glycosyltransferase family 2 protein n=1 Tax=Pedobacter nanyangensis TaxID=1562389 RepID=UPI000DE2E844|nr:glycosyltransferase family 2 protein [Pedobacter nanyangensis]
MNIYIKTFNRPFYLERCISSILFNVSNYDQIIILDDGTKHSFREKIQQKFPMVKWVQFHSDDEKYDLIRSGKKEIAKKKYGDPASFWQREIEKEAKDYFLLIEDDTWFVNMIDLEDYEKVLFKENAVICKLWWADDYDLTYVKHYHLWNSLSIDFFKLNIKDLSDAYQIYIVAMAIFRKDYYLNAIKNVNHFADEVTQLSNTLSFYSKNRDVSYCKTSERVIYQGWATSIRHDDAITIDVGMSNFEYVDSLNLAWAEDRLDVLNNYPFDFDMDSIVSVFKSSMLEDKLISTYIDWRTKPQLNSTQLHYNL